jgi:hypothetical protein
MWLMDMLLWCTSKQPLPDQVDFEVSETAQGISFKIRAETVEAIAGVASSRPLQIIDATTGTPPVATIRVRAGSIGGQAADSSMDLTDDDPVFSFSTGVTGSAGTKYIYSAVKM